ncbi:hypothetical protein EVAR_14835_1 [Eumeta japonica]|uniref:Uncharacterized protein n=1 Tax=Eumeta variegata TaxID=151549 RepID=A0A4C1V567_EUMVA|nr:hypothetical protein EVAR_14835_1 [Eumeta japonica]
MDEGKARAQGCGRAALSRESEPPACAASPAPAPLPTRVAPSTASRRRAFVLKGGPRRWVLANDFVTSGNARAAANDLPNLRCISIASNIRVYAYECVRDVASVLVPNLRERADTLVFGAITPRAAASAPGRPRRTRYLRTQFFVAYWQPRKPGNCVIFPHFCKPFPFVFIVPQNVHGAGKGLTPLRLGAPFILRFDDISKGGNGKTINLHLYRQQLMRIKQEVKKKAPESINIKGYIDGSKTAFSKKANNGLCEIKLSNGEWDAIFSVRKRMRWRQRGFKGSEILYLLCTKAPPSLRPPTDLHNAPEVTRNLINGFRANGGATEKTFDMAEANDKSQSTHQSPNIGNSGGSTRVLNNARVIDVGHRPCGRTHEATRRPRRSVMLY